MYPSAPEYKPQFHLTTDDLKFLIFNKVAIRYQHNDQHKHFIAEGHIQGDAYSLADPHMWFPPDEQKTENFERQIRHIIGRMCQVGFQQGGSDGWLVLLKDQYRARSPERRRDSYPGPLFPIGRATQFSATDIMGSLQITDELLGRNKEGGFDFSDKEITDRIADQIIGQIKHAREQATGHEAAMKEDFGKLAEERGNWEWMVSARRKDNIPGNDGFPWY